MALYTVKGDRGTTKLFDSKKGVRLSKTSEIFEALGTLDELNCIIGWVKVACTEDVVVGQVSLERILTDVQDHLFTIQAELAGADTGISKGRIEAMEALIADIESYLPPIASFLVPGGNELSARLDVARAVARRAERRVITVHEKKKRKIHEHSRTYLNRLSSLLYALVRLEHERNGLEERPPEYK